MTTHKNLLAIALALGAAFAAQAQTTGAHPAVGVHNAVQGIDPNTFIVAHPAQLLLKRGHAGHEHPALATKRLADVAGVDANTFLVQPPASTTWALESAPAVVVAVAGAAGR